MHRLSYRHRTSIVQVRKQNDPNFPQSHIIKLHVVHMLKDQIINKACVMQDSQ